MRLAPELVERFAAAADVIRSPSSCAPTCDALTGHRAMPELVVLPSYTAEVRRSSRSATTRAFRSSLAAPAPASPAARCRSPTASSSPWPGSTGCSRSISQRRVVVEPGVTNLEVTRAVSAGRLLLRARPVVATGVHDRRQRRRELGRRAHCLKYGFTVNHVLAAEIVLPGRRAGGAVGVGRRYRSARACSSAPRERSGSRRS